MNQKKQTPPPPLQPEDYYINEQGLMVFTEKYHLKRGYCCGSGCKHCPFPILESSSNSTPKP
jgi:Family of unknown function (DUF5522)